MANVNFLVNTLPDYVQTNRDILLKTFALAGAGTREKMTIQTGVKLNAYVNFLDVDPTLQDGTACGFSAAGDVELSQRLLNAPPIKVNMEICSRTLIGKYAEYLVRNNANAESLPFEAEVMQGVTDVLNNKIEKLVWQGDKTKTSDADLKWIDGLLKILAGESTAKKVAIAAGSSAYAGIIAVFKALPAEARKRGATIFVAPEIFDQFALELVAANLYHYSGPQNEEPSEIVLPGTACRVAKTYGLEGSLKVVGTFARNLIYGTDMQGDEEDIRLWYSEDHDVFRLKVLWNSGVQVAFPDLCVVGTFAAAPTSPAGVESIAANVAKLADDSHVFNTKAAA